MAREKVVDAYDMVVVSQNLICNVADGAGKTLPPGDQAQLNAVVFLLRDVIDALDSVMADTATVHEGRIPCNNKGKEDLMGEMELLRLACTNEAEFVEIVKAGDGSAS